MNSYRAFFALLIFPGLLTALPLGWLMLGIERKLKARFQGRIGPPLSQPFYDVVKLLSKLPVNRVASDKALLTGLPLLAIASMLGTLAMMPIFQGESGFVGDMIVSVSLLEIPPLCFILAGYASRSIYGELGATREAVVSIASNIPFLAALVAMATSAGSMHNAQIVSATPWLVRIPALAAILFCLPIKLRLNPFSLANAEQEVLAGPLTEFDGPRLALWELAHALEWVALLGFAVVLAIPYRSPLWYVNAAAFVLLSLALVPLLTLLAASTARLKLAQATSMMWRWGGAVAALALAAAFFVRNGGH